MQVEEGVMDDTFLDLISKCQSHRLDDQRSDLPSPPESSDRSEDDDLFETLWKLQSSRIDEQRCQMPIIGKTPSSHRWQEAAETQPQGGEALSRDELFELIFASQVRARCVCLCVLLFQQFPGQLNT